MRNSPKVLACLAGLMLIATIAACSSGVPKEEHDATLAEWAATIIQLTNSEVQYASALGEIEDLQAQFASLETELQTEINRLQSRLAFVQRSAEAQNAWYTLGLSTGHSELGGGCLSQEDIAELEKVYMAERMND